MSEFNDNIENENDGTEQMPGFEQNSAPALEPEIEPTPELKPQETIEIEEEPVRNSLGDEQDMGDGITVGDPMKLRPVELPLVVKLPATASEAQKRFALTLNAYAYQNPKKWEQKKDVLIAKLKSLKNAEVMPETGLKINNSPL